MKNIKVIFLLIAIVVALPFIGKAQKNTKPNVTIENVNELFKKKLSRQWSRLLMLWDEKVMHAKKLFLRGDRSQLSVNKQQTKTFERFLFSTF